MKLLEYAKKHGFDSLEFVLMTPGGIFKGKFLDAYFEMMLLPDLGEGFVTMKQLIGTVGFDKLKFAVITDEEEIEV